MDRLRKKIENLLSAVTFAEEGAFEYARSFVQEGRKVLLALEENHIDMKTVKYALNTSKRVGAGLDILLVSTSNTGGDSGEPFLSELKAESIPYRIIRRSGCLKQEIIDYTKNVPEVLFTVVETRNGLQDGCSDTSTKISELWQNLGCPVIVVLNGAQA